MGSLRSIIVEIFLGLSLIVVVFMVFASVRRSGAGIWKDVKAGLTQRRRLQTMDRINELLNRFDNARIKQIAFALWDRDFSRTIQISSRSSFSKDYGIPPEESFQKTPEEQERLREDCRTKLQEMDREALLRVINVFLEERSDKRIDPYGTILEIVDQTDLTPKNC